MILVTIVGELFLVIRLFSMLVGVLDRGVLNQRVKMYCVSLIPDGDAKRHKVYTGSGNRCPTSSERAISYSLHRGACSRGLQAERERELVPGLCVEWRGLLEMLISCSEGACVLQSVVRCLHGCLLPTSGPGHSLL